MSHYEENKMWKVSTGLIFWGGTIQIIFSFIGLCIFLYLILNMTDILLSGILPSVASWSFDYYWNNIAPVC